MTRRLVSQLTLHEGSNVRKRAFVLTALAVFAGRVEGLERSHAGPHHEGSVGGSDLTWDLLFADEHALAAFCDRVDGAGAGGFFRALGDDARELASMGVEVVAAIPERISGHLGAPGLAGVKRTLWLEVLPGTPSEALRRFEEETPLLAKAVPAIRNWSWSRIRTTDPRPMATRFTHLWEQEFETFEGLEVDYMCSPCHWGYIDRWFDPEMPEAIVDLRLGHLACPATESVLSWEALD